MEHLSLEDIDFILESLKYTRLNFENKPIGGPQGYPTYEYKRQRLDEVEKVTRHVREYKDSRKKSFI